MEQRKSLESAVSPQRDGFARSPHQEQQKEQALAQKDKDQTQAPTPQLKLETGEEEDIIAEVITDFAGIDHRLGEREKKSQRQRK